MKTGVVVNNLNDHTKNPELVRAGYRLLGEAKHYQKKQKESANKIGYEIAKDVGASHNTAVTEILDFRKV